jgi:hypothetical protein
MCRQTDVADLKSAVMVYKSVAYSKTPAPAKKEALVKTKYVKPIRSNPLLLSFRLTYFLEWLLFSKYCNLG